MLKITNPKTKTNKEEYFKIAIQIQLIKDSQANKAREFSIITNKAIQLSHKCLQVNKLSFLDKDQLHNPYY